MGRSKIEIDAQELRELCERGLTGYELAECFGCSPRVIARRKREYGIVYGRGHTPANIMANHDHARRNMGNAKFLDNDPLDVREQKFIERLASDPRTQMYEYVGGYKSRRDKLTIRCKTCGELKEATPSALFSNKYDHHVCFNCRRIEREEKKAERLAQYEAFCVAEYVKDKICVACGSVYHSVSEKSKFCSKKCKTKDKRTRSDSSHRHRARRYGVAYDQTITWQALSAELGHCNCQICGEPCDPSDTRWGTFGPLYPTVDCIVAMSNGGGYVKGNVQLAHAICNSAKRDLIEQDEIDKAVETHGPNGGRYEKRHEAGTIEAACA